MSKDSTQSTSVAPDAKTQTWQDLWRKSIAGVGAGVTGNTDLAAYAGPGSIPNMGLPNYGAVNDAIRTEGDRQATLNGNQADALSTADGAFGGDRAAIFRATAQNDANRNTTNALATSGLQEQQDKWGQIRDFLGLSGQAANVGGSTQTQTMQGSTLGTLLGLATTGAGIASGLGFKPFAPKAA